jgi:hypothetical protein
MTITRKSFFASLLAIPAAASVAAAKPNAAGSPIKKLYPYWHDGRLFLEVIRSYGDANRTRVEAKLPAGIPKDFNVAVNGCLANDHPRMTISIYGEPNSPPGLLTVTIPSAIGTPAIGTPGTIFVVSIGFMPNPEPIHYTIKDQKTKLASGSEILKSFDSRDWARHFVAHARARPSLATDEEAMDTWFANALVRGYDECMRYRPTTVVHQHINAMDGKSILDNSDAVAAAIPC